MASFDKVASLGTALGTSWLVWSLLHVVSWGLWLIVREKCASVCTLTGKKKQARKLNFFKPPIHSSGKETLSQPLRVRDRDVQQDYTGNVFGP
jgi:hypothetical protein